MNASGENRGLQYYRRMDFVSNRFKRIFIIRFCIVLVLGALISGAIIYGMSKATVTTTFEGSRLKIVSTADFILPAVLLSSAVVIVFVGLSAAAIVLFAYHRLQLSLSRVEAEIEKADTGDLNVDLDYRHEGHKSDEFKVLALSLNKLIRDFSRVMDAIKDDVSKLETDLGEFEAEGRVIPEKMKEELRKLKEDVLKFHK